MKEIIIDGVDVSECEKFGETIAGITCGLGKRIRFANEIITKHNLCKENPSCNYKQLKRLEQENAELKKKLQIANDTYEVCLVNKEIRYKNKIDNYKQTLQEIKADAEDGTKTEDYLLGQRYTDLIDRILDLITKAEVGNE